MSDNRMELLDHAADLVVAYVSNNSIAASQLPDLIANVHAALLRLSSMRAEAEAEPIKPAVSIKKSVTHDYIVCLEDGRRFKTLKRHLLAEYGMTPDQYRAKWGLPADYPMVAPGYAAARSELAMRMGLGQQRKKSAAPSPSSRARGSKKRSAAS